MCVHRIVAAPVVLRHGRGEGTPPIVAIVVQVTRGRFSADASGNVGVEFRPMKNEEGGRKGARGGVGLSIVFESRRKIRSERRENRNEAQGKRLIVE